MHTHHTNRYVLAENQCGTIVQISPIEPSMHLDEYVETWQLCFHSMSY